MSELVPGTPEYQEAYDKEMQRLEAGDPKEPPKEEPKEEPKEPITLEKPDETKQRLESLEKALKDTQAWGTRTSQELARLKKEREVEKHASTRPPILDQTPGLEDAIKHVATVPERPSQENWLMSVSQAIPDVEQLLGNQEFHSKAQQKRMEFGTEWDNPLIAIRELSTLKAEHLKNQAVSVAVEKAREQARQDFESKAKKKTAMSVPGGSGGRDSTKTQDDAQKVWDMPEKDFQSMRSKVLGY
jgi:hypothetical protein